MQARGSPVPDESHDHQTVLEGVEEPAEFSYSTAKSARPETEKTSKHSLTLYREDFGGRRDLCFLC